MTGRLRMFDPVIGRQRRRPVLWGGLVLAGIVAIVLVVLVDPFAPGGTIVHARFAPGGEGRFATTPLHIFPSTPVRVHGVRVGTVDVVTPVPGGGVDMALEITKPGVVVHGDARADLYYRTLLGRNVYVELDPGSHAGPAIGREGIPASRTTSQVELDQVFSAFQADARRGQKQLFAELNAGLATGAAHATLSRMPSALAATAAAERATRGENPGADLPKLVRGGRRTLAALAADEGALTGLLDSGALALGVTAARQADLGALVERSPATLQATRVTMARLRTTLDELDPVAEQLRAGVRAVAPAMLAATPTMHAIAGLVPVALPAFRDLGPALIDLQRAGAAGVPMMRAFAPTLDRTSTEIVPFLDRRTATTKLKNYEAIGPFFGAIASSAATFDAGGYMQRFQPGQRLAAPTLPMTACTRQTVHGASRADVRRACAQLMSALRVALPGEGHRR
jgi:ABC-type transporter Mla subunit MlaD